MTSNSSQQTTFIEDWICPGTAGSICADLLASTIVITSNVVTILANIVHLYIISRRLPSLRATSNLPYLRVLQHTSIGDILAALMYIVRQICGLRILGTQHKWLMILLSVSDSTLVMKYYLVMTACMERVIALSYPFNYQTTFLIQRINLVVLVQWIVIVSLSLVRDVVWYDTVCIGEAFGPSNIFNLQAKVLTFVPPVFGSIMTIAFIMKIFFELHSLHRRSISNHQLRDVLMATKYVIIITAVFFALLIPSVVVPLSVDLSEDWTTDLLYAVFLTNACYGVFNTVIYGFTNRTYRLEVCRMFTIVSASVRPVSNVGTDVTY